MVKIRAIKPSGSKIIGNTPDRPMMKAATWFFDEMRILIGLKAFLAHHTQEKLGLLQGRILTGVSMINAERIAWPHFIKVCSHASACHPLEFPPKAFQMIITICFLLCQCCQVYQWVQFKVNGALNEAFCAVLLPATKILLNCQC